MLKFDFQVSGIASLGLDKKADVVLGFFDLCDGLGTDMEDTVLGLSGGLPERSGRQFVNFLRVESRAAA